MRFGESWIQYSSIVLFVLTIPKSEKLGWGIPSSCVSNCFKCSHVPKGLPCFGIQHSCFAVSLFIIRILNTLSISKGTGAFWENSNSLFADRSIHNAKYSQIELCLLKNSRFTLALIAISIPKRMGAFADFQVYVSLIVVIDRNIPKWLGNSRFVFFQLH